MTIPASVSALGSGWLDHPLTQVFVDSAGKVEAAFVKFREGRAARVEQPDSACLVFLYVSSDEAPLGVKLLEAAPGTLKALILSRLISVSNGVPREDRGGGYRFGPSAPDGFVDDAFTELTKAGRIFLESA